MRSRRAGCACARPLKLTVRRARTMNHRSALALALLIMARPASPACLLGSYSVADEWARSSYIVTATLALSVPVPDTDTSQGGMLYVIRVLKTYKGKATSKLKIFSENSSGRFPLESQKTYLLFVSPNTVEAFRDPILTVDNCGNSGPLPQSEATLDQVRELSARLTIVGGGREAR